MFKSISSLRDTAMRALPYFFTICLFFSLMIVMFKDSASAESTGSPEEESLPEYNIVLSDSGSSSDCSTVTVTGSRITITETGSYHVSGSLSSGQLRVETDSDSKVRLILNGVSITNPDSAAIYVVSADKVVLRLADGSSNTLTTAGSFVQTDENNVDAVVFSKDDLTVSGGGSLTVYTSDGHGIVSKDDLKIKGGNLSVTAGRKALSANDTLTVEDGILSLNAGTEGMEATYVLLNGGSVSIQAGDDGINATWNSDTLSPGVEINGGSISIAMGPGDTDGIDSNGSLIITGGSIDITGSSSFDCDGQVSFTGGTVIVNGQQVDTIPSQMMGGMGRGGRGNMAKDGQFNNDTVGVDGSTLYEHAGRQDSFGDLNGLPDGGIMGPGGQHNHGSFGAAPGSTW